MLTMEKSTYIIDKLYYFRMAYYVFKKGGNIDGKRKDDISA